MTVTVERAREILLELVPRLATIFQATRLPTVTDDGVLTDGQKSEPATLICEHAFVAQVLDWYGPTLEIAQCGLDNAFHCHPANEPPAGCDGKGYPDPVTAAREGLAKVYSLDV